MRTATSILTTDRYISGVGVAGFENWSARPFWPTVQSLDEHLLSLPTDVVTRAVRNAFITQFVESAASISRAALTTQLMALGEDWSTSEACWKAADSPDLRNVLRDGQPVIARRIEKMALIYRDAANKLAERIEDQVVKDLGTVTHIRLLGDLHVRGAVALLYIDSRPQLVYKPRSLETDRLLEGILEILRNGMESAHVPRHPRSWYRGDYGFQEYIKYSSPSPGPERASFYEQYGVLIALAHVLRLRDLHYENIRATALGPVILDAECILSYDELNAVPDPETQLLYNTPSSVLSNDILPNWRVTYVSAGPREVTSLGNYNHKDRYRVIRSTSNEDGIPRYVYKPSDAAGPMPHQPAEEQGVFPAGQYEDDLLRGFDAAYRAIMTAEVRKGIVALASAAYSCRTRLVPADTATYETLLQSSRQSGDDPRPTSGALAEALFDGERFAIEHGVVPLFERRLGDGALFLDDGSTVSAAAQSPLEKLTEQLDSLSEKDLADQRTAVTLSLKLGSYNPSDGSPPSIALPAMTSLTASIDTLVAELKRSILGAKGHPWAITSQEVGPNYFNLQSAPPGLYTGVSGISFALGIAGLENAAARRTYTELRDAFLDSLISGPTSGASRQRAPIGTTLSERGYLGPLLSMAVVAEATRDSETLRLVADLGRVWADTPWDPNGFDLIGGVGGVALGLGRLFELTGDGLIRDCEAIALESLVEMVERKSAQQTLPVGMAHGLSGLAAVFSSAAVHLAQPDLRTTAQLCLAIEDEAIRSGRCDDRAEGWSWCWGAVGQLAARLVSEPDSARIPQLRDAIRSSRATNSLSYGICHGIAGSALLMNSNPYRNYFGESDRGLSEFLLGRLSVARGSRAGAPDFAPDFGLFTGTAGVLVYLSSIRDGASFSIHDLRYEPCKR